MICTLFTGPTGKEGTYHKRGVFLLQIKGAELCYKPAPFTLRKGSNYIRLFIFEFSWALFYKRFHTFDSIFRSVLIPLLIATLAILMAIGALLMMVFASFSAASISSSAGTTSSTRPIL